MSNKRIALVTGAGRGIGEAVCRALASDGLAVALADLDFSAVEHVANEIGNTSAAFGVNVSDEASVAALFDAVEDALGKVTVVVTCAGIQLVRADGQRPQLANTSLAEWDRVMSVNATGCFLTVREFARRLPERVENGRVVTMSSVGAQMAGAKSATPYVASKAAILGLTKSFANELAYAGVTVNCVAPGMIDTSMFRLFVSPHQDEEAAKSIALRSIGTPGDVAGAVSYLVSPAARYVTGLTLDVNGGLRMQ